MAALTVQARVGADGSMEFFDVATGVVVQNIGLTNGTPQYTRVILTAAQVKALHGTPITLLTPPTGKSVWLMDAAMFLNFNTTPYAAGSAVQILQNTIAVATTTAALVNNGSAILIQMAFPALGTTASLGATNGALTITAAGAEFTTGDSPINVNLWYSIL